MHISHSSDASQAAMATLIGDIYEAGIDPARWAQVVTGAARLIGGSASLVYGLEDARHQAGWFGHRFPASAMESYAAHFQSTNVWAHEIDRRRIPVGVPVITDALVELRRLERSEFYADYLRNLDIHRACTVLLRKDEQTGSESHLCIYRSCSESAFEADAGNLMQLLVPHLQRAQRTGRMLGQLDMRAQSAFAAIDAMSFGIVMFSSHGTVLHLNPAAAAIMSERDGLTVVRGRLRMARDGDSSRLASLIARASPGGGSGRPVGGALLLHRPSGKRPLQLAVSPLSDRSVQLLGSDANATAMCLISGHETQMADASQLLPQLYGLTPAETRLATGLMDGLSITEFAASNGISTNTAKTQLAGLFAKTGTHRQAALVAVLHAACGHQRFGQ